MTPRVTRRSTRRALLGSLVVLAAACGSSGGGESGASVTTAASAPVPPEAAPATDAPAAPATEAPAPTEAPAATEATAAGPPADFVLRVGAIPDQDPEKLARQFGAVSEYLSATTGAQVEYVPVADYAAAVTGFKVGDLDLVWFGGLTGVQARSLVPDAVYVAQRDVDATFQSVFIANVSAGIAPFTDVAGLSALKGHSLSFGSESSTSGRLMPQYFLGEAGVGVADLTGGQPGFSGSHDQTIRVVEAATFEVGALNKKVWDKAVAEGTVDTTKVSAIFTTPEYFDYHWLAQASLDERAGAGFTQSVTDALLALSKDDPKQAELLDLFGGGAGAFIPTQAENYAKIEAVARELGLLTT